MKQTILLFLIVMLFSCSKNEPSSPESKLPPETQTGANTFGCLIDGNLFLPRSGNTSLVFPLSGARLFGGYPDVYDYFELEIIDYKSNFGTSLFFHMHNIVENGVGSYTIDASNGMTDIDGLDNNYIHCDVFNAKTNTFQKYVSYENSGIYTVSRLTVNTNNTIISGTFSCRLRNINNPDEEIKITQGRFDINSLTIAGTYFP